MTSIKKTSSARALHNAKQPLEALASPKGNPAAGLPSDAPRPLEWLAVELAAKKSKGFRDAVRPGSGQAVDFTVRIKGSIDVAEDQTATITKKPNLGDVLAVVFSTLSKKTREAAVEEVLARFGGDDPAARGSAEIEIGPEWTHLVESLQERISREETQHRRGNVTGSLMTEVLLREC